MKKTSSWYQRFPKAKGKPECWEWPGRLSQMFYMKGPKTHTVSWKKIIPVLDLVFIFFMLCLLGLAFKLAGT